jgi:lipid-binding SYLF domain-containing protein
MKSHLTIARATCAILLSFVLAACITGNTVEQKRAAVQTMRNEVLNELYIQKPDVRDQVATSVGYAVFSNANVNLILASFGGGYGLVHNNASGADTYLRLGEIGIGFGAGIKDFRLVMVFHNQDALQRFMDYGVAVGAQADAAAVANDQGGAVGGELTLDNITVYQITEAGLALQATVKGTKYWRDPELN